MSIQKRPMVCLNHGEVLAERNGPNHILHLLLTLLTAGIWLLVWMAVGLRERLWACPYCGAKVQPTAEERGERRAQAAMLIVLVAVFGYLFLSNVV